MKPYTFSGWPKGWPEEGWFDRLTNHEELAELEFGDHERKSRKNDE